VEEKSRPCIICVNPLTADCRTTEKQRKLESMSSGNPRSKKQFQNNQISPTPTPQPRHPTPSTMKHTRPDAQSAARLAGQYWPCNGICGGIGGRDFQNVRGSRSLKPETTYFVHNPNIQGSGA
jgi:hypothetical protein